MLVIIYNTDYDTVIIWWNSNYGQQQKLWNEEWRSCALSSYGHLCRAGTLKMGGAFEKSIFLKHWKSWETILCCKKRFSFFSNTASHLNSGLTGTLKVVNQLIRVSSYLSVLLQNKERKEQGRRINCVVS